MPIYAYRCANCGHAQDVLQRISDPVLTKDATIESIGRLMGGTGPTAQLNVSPGENLEPVHA